METAYVVKEYIRWHYGQGFTELGQLWKNLMWFFYHFFSIPLLAKTLASPLYRIHEPIDVRKLEFESIAQSITVNLFARFLGLFMRLTLIAIGLAIETALLIAGPLTFAVWFALPVLSPLLVVAGIALVLI